MNKKITIYLSDGSDQSFWPFDDDEIKDFTSKSILVIKSDRGDCIFNPSHIMYFRIEELEE